VASAEADGLEFELTIAPTESLLLNVNLGCSVGLQHTARLDNGRCSLRVWTTTSRLTYAPSAANWELAVFGTNLTNEYYLNSGFFHSLWDIDFATVGVSLRVLFD
jgi:hypothetical protein